MRMSRIFNFNPTPHDARFSNGYAANALLYQFFCQSNPALNEERRRVRILHHQLYLTSILPPVVRRNSSYGLVVKVVHGIDSSIPPPCGEADATTTLRFDITNEFQSYPARREDMTTLRYCVPGPYIALQFYPTQCGDSASMTPVESSHTRYFNLTPHSAGKMGDSSRLSNSRAFLASISPRERRGWHAT